MTIVRPHDGSGWQVLRTAGEASVAMTRARARDGDGSLELVQDGLDALADFGLFWRDPGRTLGGLTEIAFDWQVADGGSTFDILAPALRLHYDADADLATPTDRGALIWEWKHNADGPAPLEAWQQADLSDDHFWMFKHAPGEAVLQHDVGLKAWASGEPGVEAAVAPDQLSASSLITGIELASGNGWPGSFRGFVDNVKVAFGEDLIVANFEPLLFSPFTPGNDRIDLNEFDLKAHQDTSRALAGDDVVWLSETQNAGRPFDAGDGDDRIYGNRQDDRIDGGGGRDRLSGRAGDDVLDGAAGDDELRGGRDHDALFGRDGNDVLYGHQGHDLLDGGAGHDLLSGGGSRDVFRISGDRPGHDRILDFRSGMDVLRLDAVLDPGGNEITAFADLDDHTDGRLDAADTAFAAAGEELTWQLHGGSLTLEGVLALTPADVVIA